LRPPGGVLSAIRFTRCVSVRYSDSRKHASGSALIHVGGEWWLVMDASRSRTKCTIDKPAARAIATLGFRRKPSSQPKHFCLQLSHQTTYHTHVTPQIYPTQHHRPKCPRPTTPSKPRTQQPSAKSTQPRAPSTTNAATATWTFR